MKRWIVLVLLTLAFGLGDGVFAQTTDGTDERADIEAAQQLLNDGLITEALDAFSLILRERPDDVDALIGRSTALSRLNRPRLAIADGLQAVKLAHKIAKPTWRWAWATPSTANMTWHKQATKRQNALRHNPPSYTSTGRNGTCRKRMRTLPLPATRARLTLSLLTWSFAPTAPKSTNTSGRPKTP
ncbi:MAG UNVERIFIED_CONTAM: hypothetical protein LVT10_02380 [Anaerolineae bacterium]